MLCVYVTAFCLLAFTVHTGTGLRCWTCTSLEHRDCGDPFNKTFVHMSDCDVSRSSHPYIRQTQAACKKEKQISDGREQVIRSCVWDKETACTPSPQGNIKDVFCETCIEDGCNSAHRFTSATCMTLIPAILWAFAAKFL